MSSNIKVMLVLTALITGSAAPALFVDAQTTRPEPGNPAEPHDFRALGLECRTCHKVVGVKTSGGLVKGVSEICYGCHSLSGKLSHPVDVKPSFSLPAGLPLSEDGIMTCATCHDPHKSYRNALTNEKTHYLRREGPKKLFCMSCHEQGAKRRNSQEARSGGAVEGMGEGGQQVYAAREGEPAR